MALLVTPRANGFTILSDGADTINPLTIAAALPGATNMGDDALIMSDDSRRVAELGAGADVVTGALRETTLLDTGAGNDVVNVRGAFDDPDRETSSPARVHLGDGDDRITFLNPLPGGIDGATNFDVVVYGEAGNDLLVGASSGERFYGGDGADRMLLGEAAGYGDFTTGQVNLDVWPNRAFGDAGDDIITGGPGADIAFGGLGN